MNRNSKLTSNTYIMYAMKNYDNPQCLGIDEFYEDLNRIKYLKRLFKRYVTTGELKERLILNHIIVLSNVFGIEASTRLMFFRMEEEYYEILKTFMVFLNVFPEDSKVIHIKEANLVEVGISDKVMELLKNI